MSSLRAALEEAIAADPDDLAAHAAYADLLNEQGDPRGEFIQVQLALEDPACPRERRRQLQQREEELLAPNERRWLGPLAPYLLDLKPTEYQSSRGFISRSRWRRGWVDDVYFFFANFAELRALKACPLTRILSRLDLHHVYWYEAGDNDEKILPEDNVPPNQDFSPLYVLLDAPFLPHLRWLRVGEAEDFDRGHYNNEADGHGLVEVLRKTSRLEELHILAHNVDLHGLFALDNLTRLRELTVYHGVEDHPIEVLAANRFLPALERLRLHPAHGDPDEGSFLRGEQVAHLFHSPHFPALRHLHVHGSDLGDAGCREIVQSGILKRLETLDLRFGCITDTGARLLAECPDIRHLKHLSLADNQISDAMCDQLEELGIDVRLGEQAEVGSDDYLWTGDME